MEQLLVYAALYCLEYKVKPREIEIELRIYQSEEVLFDRPTAEDIVPIMDGIITKNKFLSRIFSLILWVLGALLIGLMEWNNPATMGGLSVPGKIMASLFQSVSTRTAGMNTIDLEACGPVTKLWMSILQFIGAAPGSTGGGVKVTTIAVVILTIRSVAQGRDDCVIHDHHIESKTIYRALTIIMLGAVAALGSAVVVYYNSAEAVTVIDAIFESCSAFGTVGLSVGVTGRLNTGAKLLYMLVMFMGRVGPVSLAISLTAKPDDNKRKVMPVGHINVG